MKLKTEKNNFTTNVPQSAEVADQKKKFAEEIVDYPEAPKELISISELILKQQGILAKNGENQRKREKAQSLLKRSEDLEARIYKSSITT